MVTPSCDRMKPSRDVCTPRAGSHEGEGDAWCLLIFSSESRRPDILREDSLTRGSGRPIAPTQRMNVRPWSDLPYWLAPSIPS